MCVRVCVCVCVCVCLCVINENYLASCAGISKRAINSNVRCSISSSHVVITTETVNCTCFSLKLYLSRFLPLGD